MSPLPPQLQAVKTALDERRFFKLIAGGSLTEAPTVAKLAWIYAMAGADCVDIAPDLDVIDAVSESWTVLPKGTQTPLLMVSFPLDADPHFRKIEVEHKQCILCDACIPVCPTDAISLTEDPVVQLAIHQPLCYGCNRCVEVCPTEALTLYPFRSEDELAKVLQHPEVGAVEIHTRWCDIAMLESVYCEHQANLTGKLIAICFAPTALPRDSWVAFMEQAQGLTERYFPGQLLVWQIDGQPMSGTSQAEATLPALHSALDVANTVDLHKAYLTISGGINSATPGHLSKSPYHEIHGAGMGTMARKAVWQQCQEWLQTADTKDVTHLVQQQRTAVEQARLVVAPFQNRYDTSGAISESMMSPVALAK